MSMKQIETLVFDYGGVIVNMNCDLCCKVAQGAFHQ